MTDEERQELRASYIYPVEISVDITEQIDEWIFSEDVTYIEVSRLYSSSVKKEVRENVNWIKEGF